MTTSQRLCVVWLGMLAACGGAQGADETVLLQQGQQAPVLEAVDHQGRELRVPGERPWVVYFYPKDGTPGCTEEACAFRDVWDRYEQARIGVVGISKDSNARHLEFARDHQLPFPLVSDAEGAWARAYGVRGVLGMLRRVTFIVDTTGRVLKVYPDVDPGVHALEILDDLRGLGLAP